MFDSSVLGKATQGMIQINQNDGLLSPHMESTDQSIGIFLKQKFTKLHHRQREQIIKNVFHNLYGRHNAVKYKPQYNFHERWQEQTKPTYYHASHRLVKTENMMPPMVQLSLLILYASNIWFLTIYRLFYTHDLVLFLLPFILITQIMDICLKIYFIRKAITQNHYSKGGLSLKDYLCLHWSNIVFLPYCLFIALQNNLFPSEMSLWLAFIDYFFIWRAYLRLDELYQGIKIRIMASKHRNQLQIVQLLARCICVIHFFVILVLSQGIIVYFVAQTNPEHNWTLQIEDFHQSWVKRYIYSLYFASTTLTTVGYGDITPKNLMEIITILFAQVFGIINFGYIVNEIGRILAKINQKQQILTKNISQAENITETYKIPESLAFQMRSHIINNQIAHDQLNVEDQDNFMRKLNDQIREGFNSFNQIRIIKSSIFFLCHWSKKFQRNIASKLVRNIYSPQESLLQPRGREKLYILTRGKIDIIACMNDHLMPIAIRPLKVIAINPAQEVHFNVYGYSQLISGLEINLKAVARDYSICYTLLREDFLNTIIQDQRDFEYFHEIKARIQQSYFREIWQAPNITNTREHYLPNPYYILMRNRHKSKNRHQRRDIFRKFKKTKCYIQAEVQASSQEIESQNSESSNTNTKNDNLLEKIMHQPSITPENQILNAKERQVKYENAINANNLCLVKNRGYNHKAVKRSRFFNDEQEKKKFEDRESKQQIFNNFEQNTKCYAYFPKFNLAKTLEKYQKIYHKFNTDMRSEKSMRLDSKSQIPEQIMEKLLNIRVFGSQNLD